MQTCKFMIFLKIQLTLLCCPDVRLLNRRHENVKQWDMAGWDVAAEWSMVITSVWRWVGGVLDLMMSIEEISSSF